MKIFLHTILSILIFVTFAVGVFAGDSERKVRTKPSSSKATNSSDTQATTGREETTAKITVDESGIIQKSSHAGERIDWQTISNGGGWSTATGLQLFSVVSQTAAGASTNGSYRLQHGFLQHFGLSSCCIGVTGNIDCDPGNTVDIADLTVLIDHMFISLNPLCCRESGNVDGDPTGEVGLADLTTLIDHLFINLLPTAACQ